MKKATESTEVAEWRLEVRRLTTFWFGARGFRPKMMRGGPMLGWPESPRREKAKKGLKKSDRMASRY